MLGFIFGGTIYTSICTWIAGANINIWMENDLIYEHVPGWELCKCKSISPIPRVGKFTEAVSQPEWKHAP